MTMLRPDRIFTTAVITIMTTGFVSSCAETPWQKAGNSESGHSGCFLCHRKAEPESEAPYGFVPGIEPSSVCLDCHHYESDHHPVIFMSLHHLKTGEPWRRRTPSVACIVQTIE